MISKTHTKYIQSLWHKKFRDEKGLFIAEGPKVVLDLINSRKFVCKEIFALQSWISTHEKTGLALNDVLIESVEDFELKKISALSTANQVLAVFEKRRPPTSVSLAGKISLVLDTIQDPGNLGTIIRIADWFGVENIICSTGCADMYNAKVVQSTMGSLGRVTIIYTHLVDWLKDNASTKIYGAALDGTELKSLGKLGEGIIVIGNESHGISDEVLELVNEKITIARSGEAESLNAAVAAGIILAIIK
ncbi:MAG: RNA methyltransferase [Ferruginibacter sp.]